jgi:hypothetical protein
VAYSDPLVRFLLVENVLQLGDEGGFERERLGDHSVELLGSRRIQRELYLVRLGQEGLANRKNLPCPHRVHTAPQ